MKRKIITILLLLSTTFTAQAISRMTCDTCNGTTKCHVCEGSGEDSSGGACFICDGSEDCSVCQGTGEF